MLRGFVQQVLSEIELRLNADFVVLGISERTLSVGCLLRSGKPECPTEGSGNVGLRNGHESTTARDLAIWVKGCFEPGTAMRLLVDVNRNATTG